MSYTQYNTQVAQSWPTDQLTLVTAGDAAPWWMGSNNAEQWKPNSSSHLPLSFLVLDSFHLHIVTNQLINVRHHC